MSVFICLHFQTTISCCLLIRVTFHLRSSDERIYLLDLSTSAIMKRFVTVASERISMCKRKTADLDLLKLHTYHIWLKRLNTLCIKYQDLNRKSKVDTEYSF